MKFKEYLKEKEEFSIDKFIEACKTQLKSFEDSDNKEGVKFLSGILDSYKKNNGLSPAQVSAASKFMK
jgi:hypothetical protein